MESSIAPLTYGLTESVQLMGAKSERQLTEWLKAGRIPGRKIGREWRMTIDDIRAAIDSFGVRGQPETQEQKRSGLTPTSRRRLGI
ncbi:DNA-binding protein [Mycobacteroides chelonae]|uniref:DNA-binding protein n=1 Tax=Mycobacteroides chelonae TaxID=1774 RepID=UPI0009BCB29B|nr:DNA-binding protein [Mycobacteroides chelonae]